MSTSAGGTDLRRFAFFTGFSTLGAGEPLGEGVLLEEDAPHATRAHTLELAEILDPTRMAGTREPTT